MTTTPSIALCTCNGSSFLQALLDSHLAQSCVPGQLVVCDDASEDSSLAILEAFATRSPFPILVRRNSARVGVSANFEQAIRLCRGDLIALCDQDDVWLPHKLGRLTSALEGCSDAVAVFSDAQVVDANLNSLDYTMWQQVGFTPKRQQKMREDPAWEVLFKDPVVTGATLMFRRELLPFILPIPEGWMHDAWIAQIAASQGRLVAVDEPLILYRQHGGNVIGGRKTPFFVQIRHANALGRLGLVKREFKRYGALQERLLSFPVTPRRDVMLKVIEAKLAHLERRRRLPDNRLLRLPGVLGEWLTGNYGRYAKDWRNVAADLFMPK